MAQMGAVVKRATLKSAIDAGYPSQPHEKPSSLSLRYTSVKHELHIRSLARRFLVSKCHTLPPDKVPSELLVPFQARTISFYE